MSEYNEISSVKTSNNEVFYFADTSLRETVSQLSSNSSTITIDGDVSDLSIANVTIGEYKQILSTRTILSNELYIIRNEGYVDAYGEQIKHVAPGTELSDAVNVEQLSNLSLSLDNKIIIDDRISGIVDQSDLSVIKLSASEYEQLVYDDGTLSNALYIVEKDYLDQYGQQIKNLGAPTDLSDAATKEYIDNLISLQDFSKVFIDNRISSVCKQTDLSVIKLSSSEYEQLVYNDQTLSDALYIVENQYDNLYGQQIRNVGEPTVSSDAATKNYVDNSLQNVQIPTDLSDFTNSPNFATQGYVNQMLGDIETILNNL